MSNPGPAAANAAAAPSQNGPRQTYKKPNFNLIHKDPLPILTQPLPELVLHNPVSVARFLFSYFLATSHSHPSPLYTGIFDPNSSSVHIKDEETRTALWRSGFFGKGNLSRSEPTWLIRTKRACGVIGQNENLTPEEVTERRRIQRREFKKERDMLEKERIRAQLIKEGKLKEDKTASEDSTPTGEAASSKASPAAQPAAQPAEELVVMDIADQEHMQLTPEEAFFLAYGLGTFQVLDPLSKKPIVPKELLRLFRQYSYYPPRKVDDVRMPDDPFLVNYVVYHHFRSLGWVVKSGIKFSVDYLLYNRGPAFSHAEFAIVILPAYEDKAWEGHPRKQEIEAKRTWHWFHAVNRVCSQVKKTLIMVYVEIPPVGAEKEGDSVRKILSRYKVREIALRRWLPSRNRD